MLTTAPEDTLPRARWFDQYVAIYLDELDGFGLTLDRIHVERLLTDVVRRTASAMGFELARQPMQPTAR